MRNLVLKTITAIAIIALIIGVSGMNSEEPVIPATICGIAMGWLLPFTLANKERT